MTPEFYTTLQAYVVNAEIDRSVIQIRTKESKSEGTVEAARQFLYHVDLSAFGAPDLFPTILNTTTVALMHHVNRSVPDVDPLPWGFARKALNIFLRNSFYSYYLRPRYSLQRVEAILEIPLDENAATGLRRDAKTYGLRPPRWKNIRHLTPEENVNWQQLALDVAQKKIPIASILIFRTGARELCDG